MSLIVATVIGESWEKKVLVYMPESWTTSDDPNPFISPGETAKPERQVFWLTRVLFEVEDAFFSRGLDLREKVLTDNDLSAETISALREGPPEQRAQALQRVLGINLQGRDLRYANLAQGILPKVDLREAQLQGADLAGAQLQGVDLAEAQLQGANLREASIGGANFDGASLDLADLSGLNRTELTQNDYQKLSRDLERDVGDRELLTRILEELKTIIGRKDTLNKVKSAKQCLANDPELIDLRCTNQPAQYRIELDAYLVKLACSDPHVAFGVSMRLSRQFQVDLYNLTDQAMDQAVGLAKAFLKADCAPIKKLPENVKEGLRKVASGG